MGYHAHHAIIVTAWDEKYTATARTEAIRIFGPAAVSSVTYAEVNGYWSFMVGPDGSKEGWLESEKGDERRADFLDFLGRMHDAEQWVEFVEVRYGGDEPALARVTNNGAPGFEDEDGERKFSLAPALGGPVSQSNTGEVIDGPA